MIVVTHKKTDQVRSA